jgi:N4-gp56 family major capsid protein
MPAINNSISNLSTENQTFYDRTLLSRLLPELHFYKDAKKKKIPKGKGTKIEWRIFKSLAVPTKPLEEGVTPAGKNLDISPVTAECSQYGDYVTVSDVLDMQGKDPVIAETSALEGEQAAQLVDTLIRDTVTSGTNVRYANGKASRATLTATDVLKGIDVKKAVRDLRKNNAKTFSDGYFHAVISAEQAYDLMSDTSAGGWIDANKYTDNKPLLKGEIGEYAGVRFMTSSNTKVVDNSGVAVHLGVIYGKDSYGVPEIGDGSAAKPSIIVKTDGGNSDPLNQRNTIGWKNMFTCKRLEEKAIVRIETGVTA